MQTFLPCPRFADSARVLDRRRVWKQTIEARQILNALTGATNGWRNHPAVRMWRGHADLLTVYFQTVLRESIARGIQVRAYVVDPNTPDQDDLPAPTWLGDAAFHASHRSNLLRKDPNHYGQFGWAESSDLPYVWPV